MVMTLAPFARTDVIRQRALHDAFSAIAVEMEDLVLAAR
jgi:hypothetical protein